MGTSLRASLTGGVAALGLVLAASPAQAGGPVPIYFFHGTDGDGPRGGLVADAAGNLYGTTSGGGQFAPNGVVFQLKPPASPSGAWTETACRPYGCGTVFKLAPSLSGPWTETILYAFQGAGSGNEPASGVTFDTVGNLYGTTEQGGKNRNCCGVVFELSPPAAPSASWTETVLNSFIGPNGLQPAAGVVLDPVGNLYGTTMGGDGNGTICPGGCGVVFQLKPPATSGNAWTENVLLRFNGTNGGWGFSTLWQNDTLYGTASFGPPGATGVAFALTPTTPPRKFWREVYYEFS